MKKLILFISLKLLFCCSIRNEMTDDLYGKWQFVSYSHGELEMKCNSCFSIIINSENQGEILGVDNKIDSFKYRQLKSQIEFTGINNNAYIESNTMYEIKLKNTSKVKTLILIRLLNGKQQKYVFKEFR